MPLVERQVDDGRVRDRVLVLASLCADRVGEGDVVVVHTNADANHVRTDLVGCGLAHEVLMASASPPIRDVRVDVGLDHVLLAFHPLVRLGLYELAGLGVVLEDAAHHLP